MVKMPRFETFSFETGVKTLITETGQQLPPSLVEPPQGVSSFFGGFCLLSGFSRLLVGGFLFEVETPPLGQTQGP